MLGSKFILYILAEYYASFDTIAQKELPSH